jgi:cytoskeletal protein CcmA (bactofilin family)
MWRKPAEAKPPSQTSEPSAPASAKPQAATPVVTQAVQPASIPVETPPAAPASLVVAQTAPAARSISRISSGIRIKGEISGSDDLYIDGQAEGQFRFVQSKVTVGPNGRVQANIEARDIVVEGTVQGNLKASASVQLGGSSQVQGSITTPRISIEDGARLRGKVEMTRATDSKQAANSVHPVQEPAPEVTIEAQAAARAAGE